MQRTHGTGPLPRTASLTCACALSRSATVGRAAPRSQRVDARKLLEGISVADRRIRELQEAENRRLAAAKAAEAERTAAQAAAAALLQAALNDDDDDGNEDDGPATVTTSSLSAAAALPPPVRLAPVIARRQFRTARAHASSRAVVGCGRSWSGCAAVPPAEGGCSHDDGQHQCCRAPDPRTGGAAAKAGRRAGRKREGIVVRGWRARRGRGGPRSTAPGCVCSIVLSFFF